jgi:hypothetical protein
MDERKDGLLDRIFMSFELLDSQRKRKIIENLSEKVNRLNNNNVVKFLLRI